ncbi:MAG: hypothetical protein ISS56_12660 [Anaerolineae bacterium]|nr:hypothetical protein [Anaerolineae bacterium]
MRRVRTQRLQSIWQIVEQEPGIRPSRVAQKLGVPRSSVTRALPAMDDAGLMLSQSPKGGLWPWKRIK